MAINFPGPYQIRLNYTVKGRRHQQRLNCELDVDLGPGLLFVNYSLKRRGAAAAGLSGLVDAWKLLIDNIYNTTDAAFVDATLWKYTAGTNDAVFYSAYSIGLTGADAAATVDAGQVRLSFITQEGGTMFLDFMDSNIPSAPTESFPFATVNLDAIADFIISINNWVLGKDTSYPIAARAANPGINERWYKVLNRP